MSYRPDIDGLRAVAILAVVLFHAAPGVLPGGFVGVDVFFVVSGYLISGLIFTALDAGRFSFADFYARRVRRIFPALALMLAAVLGYGFVVLLPGELAQLGLDVAGGAGFVSNLLLWSEAGYFDRAAATKPLLHLWSLGVEEQFYLVWPLAVWAAARLGLPRRAFLASVVALSLGFSLWLSARDPAADFYWPLTRFWELACGAWLARAPLNGRSNGRSRPRDLVSVAGLGLILLACAVLNSRMPYPSWRAMLPVAGTVALIAAGPAGLVNRAVLARRFMVVVGLVSYPLYLWHWPLLSYAAILRMGRPPREGVVAVLLALSVALAFLTWRLLERPARSGGALRAKTAALAVGMALVGGAGAATWRAGGFPQLAPALPTLDIAAINAAIGDGVFHPTPGMRVTRMGAITLAEIGAGPEAVLFLGDSLAFQYGPRVQRLFEEGRLARLVYFLVGTSCPPIPGILKPPPFEGCRDMPALAERLVAERDIGTVVLAASWPGRNDGSNYADVARGDARVAVTDPRALDMIYANLEDFVAALARGGRRVVLVLGAPQSGQFDPRNMIARGWTGFRIDPALLAPAKLAPMLWPTEEGSRRLRSIAARTGAETRDPTPEICGAGDFCAALDAAGAPKFADSMHLRPGFVRAQIGFLDDLLTR